MTINPILLYFIIFFAKIVEVSMSTLRNVLNTRGEKLKGACIGFFEVLIWVILISNVLGNLSDDPAKLIIYCVAFSLGNYLGVTIENKLAIGTACIQAVVDMDKREELGEALRSRGFGVTYIHGEGKDGPVGVVMIYLKRKCVNEVTAQIREVCPNAMTTVNDVRNVRNGYIRK